MNLNIVRLTALLTVVAAFAVWSYFGLWLIGSLCMLSIVIVVLLLLGRDTDTESDDLKPDLLRQALALKVLAYGTRAGVILGSAVFAGLLIILAAGAFHQIKDGTLTLLQGLAWWISGSAVASIICAFCGFCAGSVFYLLMRWPEDRRTMAGWNETKLMHEAARQKKRLTFAHH